MIVTAIQDVVDEMTVIRGGYVVVLERFAEVSPSRENLANIAEMVEGLLARTTELVRGLAAADEASLVTVLDGKRQIEIWRWRRFMSFQLQLLVASLRDLHQELRDQQEGKTARTITVTEGETLHRIAQRELGNWRQWVEISRANPGIDPFKLQAGDRLKIPGAR